MLFEHSGGVWMENEWINKKDGELLWSYNL